MLRKILGSLVLCAALIQPGSTQALEQKAADVPTPEFKADSFVNGGVYTLLKGRENSGIDNGARIIGQNGFSLFPDKKNRVRVEFQADKKDAKSIEHSIAYAYSDGKNLLPKKESLENELSEYLGYSLCYNRGEGRFYNELVRNGRKVTANVSVSKKSLDITGIFPANYPVPSGAYINHRFKVTQKIKLNFGEFYDIAKEIVESEIKNPEELPLDVFKNHKRGYRFAMASSGNDVVYVVTAREKYSAQKPEFYVMFGNHFATPRHYQPDNSGDLKVLDFSKLPVSELTTEQEEVLSRIKATKSSP
jgi:hypothetical protein